MTDHDKAQRIIAEWCVEFKTSLEEVSARVPKHQCSDVQNCGLAIVELINCRTGLTQRESADLMNRKTSCITHRLKRIGGMLKMNHDIKYQLHIIKSRLIQLGA